MGLQRIIEIANDTKQMDLVQKLEEINYVLNTTNAPLVLPLVGEFSSGKTTLLNAITDSKKLETATKPTTATIYEVYFGNETISANVIMEDGSITEVTDIDELKNDRLKDAALVEVYDTSTKISSSTVLVDTPGLSSPDPKHKEVLIDFIPKADGILLVIDINQQITKSLIDFTKTVSLSNRPIYLIITKCDTKSNDEIESVKAYIRKNTELKVEDIVCVSAQNQNLSEFYTLLETIDSNKYAILKNVNQQRIQNLITILLERIDELLSKTENSDSLEQELLSQKRELETIKRNIDNLLDEASTKMVDTENDICRSFNNLVFERLESLVTSDSVNYDAQAISEINGIANQLLTSFKQNIQNVIYDISNERRNTNLDINLSSLREIKLSDVKISQVPYNLNLNSVGHEYDTAISGGAKVLAVVGLIAATVATAGAAAAAAGGAAAAGAGAAAGGAAAAGAGAAAGGAAAAGAGAVAGGAAAAGAGAVAGGAAAAGAGAAAGGAAAAGAGGAALIAKGIAGSVDAMIVAGLDHANNAQTRKELKLLRQQEFQRQLERQKMLHEKFNEGMELIEDYNTNLGNKTGQKNGFVEGVVSKITDKTGKPQRQRIIHNYIDDCLVPCFKNQIQIVTQNLITLVRNNLNKTKILEELLDKKKNAEEAYKNKINELQNYKKELLEFQGEN